MSSCGEGSITVLHMTHCNDIGWRAVFVSTDNERTVPESWATPVIAWLWVDHDDEQHAHPMVALAGDIIDATTVDNYVGVVSPGDTTTEAVLTANARRNKALPTLQKTA